MPPRVLEYKGQRNITVATCVMQSSSNKLSTLVSNSTKCKQNKT